MGYSPDKMLQGRLLSYPDAHRLRQGSNGWPRLGNRGDREASSSWKVKSRASFKEFPPCRFKTGATRVEQHISFPLDGFDQRSVSSRGLGEFSLEVLFIAS